MLIFSVFSRVFGFFAFVLFGSILYVFVYFLMSKKGQTFYPQKKSAVIAADFLLYFSSRTGFCATKLLNIAVLRLSFGIKVSSTFFVPEFRAVNAATTTGSIFTPQSATVSSDGSSAVLSVLSTSEKLLFEAFPNFFHRNYCFSPKNQVYY